MNNNDSDKDLGTKDVWTLQQICPASPDWRAVYKHGSIRSAFPVACWGLAVRRRDHMVDLGDERGVVVNKMEHLGMTVVGLIAGDTGLQIAPERENFEGYAAPCEDPSKWVDEDEIDPYIPADPLSPFFRPKYDSKS